MTRALAILFLFALRCALPFPSMAYGQPFMVNSVSPAQGNLPSTNEPAGGGGEGDPIFASDNFNRADSDTLGANWTIAMGFVGITNNAATLRTFNADAIALRTAEDFSDDHSSQIDFFSLGGKVGVIVRGSGTGGSFNGYVVNAADGESYVFGKFTAGSYSSIETFSATAVYDEPVKLKVVGNTFTIYTNGVVADSTTDNTFSTGGPGIILWSTDFNATADDWEGSDEE